MVTKLSLNLVLIMLFSGCACRPIAEIGVPPRPALEAIPAFDLTLQKEPPLEVRLYLEENPDVVLIRRDELMRPVYQCAENDLALKKYATILEGRIRLHDRE